MAHWMEENLTTLDIFTFSLVTQKLFILKYLISMHQYQFFSTRLPLMKLEYWIETFPVWFLLAA